MRLSREKREAGRMPRSQQKVREMSATAMGSSARMPRGRAKILEQPPGWDRTTAAGFRAGFGINDDLLGLDMHEADDRIQHKRSKTAKDKKTTAKEGRSIVRCIPKSIRHLLAGGFAGSMSKTATAPIEFVRMQMMVGQGGGLANIVATAWAKGPQAFFAGNLADVVRVTPSKAVQLAAFDSFKRVLSKRDKETGKLQPPSALATTIAGGMSGVVSTVSCFPLDVIRTRLACSSEYKGISDVVVKTVRTEGVGALYKGVTPSLLGVIPYAAINLGVYDGLRYAYLQAEKPADGKVPKGVALVCGALSGVIGSTCTFPLEVVRRRMMVGSPYNGTLHALYTISQKEGVSALFKGCLLGWVKLAPSAGLSFYCYEAAKEVLEL